MRVKFKSDHSTVLVISSVFVIAFIDRLPSFRCLFISQQLSGHWSLVSFVDAADLLHFNTSSIDFTKSCRPFIGFYTAIGSFYILRLLNGNHQGFS